MPATWTSPSGSRWEPAPGTDVGPLPGPAPEQPAASRRSPRRSSRVLVALVALLGLGGLGAGALAYGGVPQGDAPSGPAAASHDRGADGASGPYEDGDGDHHGRSHR